MGGSPGKRDSIGGVSRSYNTAFRSCRLEPHERFVKARRERVPHLRPGYPLACAPSVPVRRAAGTRPARRGRTRSPGGERG